MSKCIFKGCDRKPVAPYELYCKEHINILPGKPITELKYGECRAPVSIKAYPDGRQVELFCGKKTHGNSSYCNQHLSIFVEKIKK